MSNTDRMESEMNSADEMSQLLEMYGPRQPEAPFNYRMQTTSIMEHSRGIAWVADLYLGNVKIGVIEQAGDGGADRVTFMHPAYEIVWRGDVDKAFSGNEEAATFFLLTQEEETYA